MLTRLLSGVLTRNYRCVINGKTRQLLPSGSILLLQKGSGFVQAEFWAFLMAAKHEDLQLKAFGGRLQSIYSGVLRSDGLD